jgi:hypothetical protein
MPKSAAHWMTLSPLARAAPADASGEPLRPALLGLKLTQLSRVRLAGNCHNPSPGVQLDAPPAGRPVTLKEVCCQACAAQAARQLGSRTLRSRTCPPLNARP